MKMIVGLGNPGREYAGTRHNVGRMIVETLAERHATALNRAKFNSRLGEIRIDGHKVLLLAPDTFMNLSGRAVMAAIAYFGIDPQETLVVCDEMDLPVGKLRLRAQGGTGGHNGLLSIQQALGAQDYHRLRVGIGRPRPDKEAANYVLDRFGKDEEDEIFRAVARAADAAERWARDGVTKAMDAYNPETDNSKDPGGSN